jgi:NTP pyrophosphatase (non-canonical NTP hydrolase)
MNDQKTTLSELKIVAQELVKERDWQQFHNPKDLSMNLSVEANELLEKFLWITSESSFEEINKNRTEIEDEVGDILFSILRFCSVSNIDAVTAFVKKIEKIKLKYPVEKSKGKYQKYTKLN